MNRAYSLQTCCNGTAEVFFDDQHVVKYLGLAPVEVVFFVCKLSKIEFYVLCRHSHVNPDPVLTVHSSAIVSFKICTLSKINSLQTSTGRKVWSDFSQQRQIQKFVNFPALRYTMYNRKCDVLKLWLNLRIKYSFL